VITSPKTGHIIYKDPDTQFNKSYSIYLQSKKSHYYKDLNKAIDMFEDYVSEYPTHKKYVDALYILSGLHKESRNETKSKNYLNKYFNAADSNDFYYKFALHQKAEWQIKEGNSISANKILDSLLKTEAGKGDKGDIYFKRDIISSLIPLYIRFNNKEKLRISYEYLLSNQKFVSNNSTKNNYRFKLANLYIEVSEIEKAKSLFKQIINDREYKIKSIKEASQRKLKELN